MILILKLDKNDTSLKNIQIIRRKIFKEISCELYYDEIYYYLIIKKIGYFDSVFHSKIAEIDKNIISEIYTNKHFEKMFGDNKLKIEHIFGGRI